MSQCIHLWYADCLNVTTILAMSQDSRKLKRLARQFRLLDEASDQDVINTFQTLHEGCHQHPDLVKAIAKDLDERFRSTLLRVRSLNLKEIKSLQMNWALPLLWAVLKDDREEVRLYGRYLVHSILWSALRHASEDDRQEREAQDAIKSLEALVAGQKAEMAALNSELQKKSAELDRLKEAVRTEAPRREPPKPYEDGKGRLIREVRKLRHELARERERVEELQKSMPVDSNVFMPLDFTLESPTEAECEIQQTCLLQNQQHMPKGKECCGKEGLCEQCPLYGLRVAVVGGLSRMQPEYREVVRLLGAEMLFHNGEVKNGSYKLKSVVCGADIVVFITSVNSHGALNVVKAVCRKNGKKFIALKETGSESLAKTLRKCAA